MDKKKEVFLYFISLLIYREATKEKVPKVLLTLTDKNQAFYCFNDLCRGQHEPLKHPRQ